MFKLVILPNDAAFQQQHLQNIIKMNWGQTPLRAFELRKLGE